jgi:zinc protease
VSYLKPSVRLFLAVILLSTLLPAAALSQSGRGRPRVSQPSPSASQPEPVTVPAATAVTSQEQAGTTSRFVLHNGMTVIISEQHATPLTAAVACFKAGSLREPAMNAVAKLVERMVLRGTVQRPGDRAVADLSALGASIEATTSYDGSVYSLLASSEKFKDALAIQADMLQKPSLDGDAMAEEIPLVIEEGKLGAAQSEGPTMVSQVLATRKAEVGDQALARLMSFDDPAAYSMTRLLNIAFDLTPATIEGLRSMTRERLVDFYQSHYRPDNLIISVAGDVSTFDTLVAIQQLYGGFGVKLAPTSEEKGRAAEIARSRPSPAQQDRSSSSSTNQQQIGRTTHNETSGAATGRLTPATGEDKLHYALDRADITQSVVSIGFHLPGPASKDWPVLEVLTALAGKGRASSLSSSLIDGQMAASRINSNYLVFADVGLLAIQMTPATDPREGSSIDRAESALFKELDRLRRELPTEGEMARAKTQLEKRFVDETGTYLGRASALARAEVAGVAVRSALDYVARLRAVSAEDVRRAAARYFTLINTSIHEYEPLSAPARSFDAGSFAATVTAWAPGFAETVDNAAARPADSASPAPVPQGAGRSPEQRMLIESMQPLPIKDFSTLNGPKAFVREDHSQPKVTVAILFQGGRLIEDVSTSGITELMLRSILYGTPRRPFSLLAQELEQLGADVRIVAEPDYFGFVLSTLSRNADRALRLVREEIEEPALRDDDIARARLAQIGAIRAVRDSSLARARELLLQALFPGHPYSLPPHGREEIVAALTSDKLRDWHQRVIKRQIPVAIIVGDTDGSALVSSQIAEGFRRRDVETVTQVKVPQAATAADKIEQRRGEQTTLAIGFAGPRSDSPDLPALQLIETSMNRKVGRLLREVRDRQSAISTGFVEDYHMFVAGVIVAYAVATPGAEQRTRAALLSEFERMARTGLTSEELASSRAAAATSRVAMLQSQSEQALEYARAIFYRRQASDSDTFVERVSKVTDEDIKRVASAYFKASAASAGIVRGSSQPPPSPAKQN